MEAKNIITIATNGLLHTNGGINILLRNVEALQKALDDGGDPCQADEAGVTPLMAAADAGQLECVDCLLQAGAPWNALDDQGQCAGDYAQKKGHHTVFETLLNAAIRAELLLEVVERNESGENEEKVKDDFLNQKLRYVDDNLVDEKGNGVMMGWETPLMEKHAQLICRSKGDVLNVGFGMGIIDREIQKYNPRSHTIIEAHPDVYAHMLATGWDKKPGVKIVFGKWQDVIYSLDQFDGIFFDTFGEQYQDMKEFHELLPNVLRPGGVYSYFNGLAASTNRFFHEVYCALATMELQRIGFNTTFEDIPINSNPDPHTWDGIIRKYWVLDRYRIPTVTYASSSSDQDGGGKEEENHEEKRRKL